MESRAEGHHVHRVRRLSGVRPTVAVALVALIAAACADQPTAPDTHTIANMSFNRASAPGQLRLAGIDAEYAAIARDAPGFGGMFFDGEGRLNVYVTEVGRTPRGQSRIMARVNASLQAHDRTPVAAAKVVIRDAARDYGELTTLRSRAHLVLGEPGVVFTDIDETANRLRIGVLAGTGTEQIRDMLQQLDVPLDAVSIDITDPIVPLANLTEPHDPMGGGLQIWHFDPPFARICTLGFNVRFTNPAKSQHYFVTNSHCTAVRGTVTGTQFRQDALVLPSRIVAVEVADPPFFTCQYAGYRCRYSDAALAEYLPEMQADLGALYQTVGASTTTPGSLEINEKGKLFTIARERAYPMAGEVVGKVGRTSGWTMGPVVATCVDTGVAGEPQPTVMLCQDFVQAFSAGGDSGSPVFNEIGHTKPVTLFGILWGGNANLSVFSAMENVRAELGDFRVR